MLVKNWMSQNVITIDELDSMQNAIKLLKENRVTMLPVTKGGKLVGIATDRDLKKASASTVTTLEIHELLYLLAKIKIEVIMTKNPVTVPPDFTLEETSELLLNNKISGAPVVDSDGQIVGVITKSDIFRALISLTGLQKRGIQFAFQTEDRSGSIKELADVTRTYGGRMASILTSYDGVPEGYRKVYLTVYDVDRALLHELLEDLKEEATLLYMVDYRDNRRTIAQ